MVSSENDFFYCSIFPSPLFVGQIHLLKILTFFGVSSTKTIPKPFPFALHSHSSERESSATNPKRAGASIFSIARKSSISHA